MNHKIPIAVGDLIIDPLGPVGYCLGWQGVQVNIKWITPYGCLDPNQDGLWSFLAIKHFKLYKTNQWNTLNHK